MARSKIDPEFTTLPPADRLPTAEEMIALDCYAAWDMLSPETQRDIGALAVKLSVAGHRMMYPRDAPAWTIDRRETIDRTADEALNALGEELERFWPQFFGWVRSAWSKPVIRQVA
jgi:hypothetical protein